MRQALYRAYRPRTFDEVVGQDAITTILRREMASGQPSHAYLFVGSRGTGKTTCAKLVAKAVNCEHLHDGNPCNECATCRGIDEGSVLDVEEIDAASNNGVDDARDLREKVVYMPNSAKYRVYIIDEVHMLSPAAFNALLKTIEEPPKHVIFILATTEINKVLPTIVSRCQRFDFQRIDSDVIAARLMTVAEREGFSLSNDAAQLIARMSDGGMRDALSLLDVCAAGNDDVTLDIVAQAAGIAGSDKITKLVGYIFSGDTQGVLTFSAELIAKGFEPMRLCERLIGHFRDLMLIKTIECPEKLVSCLPSEVPSLREQGKQIALSDLLADISVLQDASSRMSRTASKRTELELALVQLTEPSVKTGTAALLQRIERLEHMLEGGFAQGGNDSINFSVSKRITEEQSVDDLPIAAQNNVYAQPKADNAKSKFENDEKIEQSNKSQIFRPWPQVLEAIANTNGALAGMMIGTVAYFDGKHVLIDIKNPILLEMLRTNDYTRSSIRRAIRDVTGQDCPIGPYRAAEKTEQKPDPLDALISSLPNDERIIIH